ncbi:hypothetical protein CSOJ01_09810 [Colletotrichum sojae]|uniref:MYND-type domain-containing protein n=1 Tax=Colletotrichum sojae TaxID=2175907 RepID=A0A8H6J218_9PEZI|nr:hypothetical protein CSOJ01_09810 [Colletotrichum sojae]
MSKSPSQSPPPPPYPPPPRTPTPPHPPYPPPSAPAPPPTRVPLPDRRPAQTHPLDRDPPLARGRPQALGRPQVRDPPLAGAPLPDRNSPPAPAPPPAPTPPATTPPATTLPPRAPYLMTASMPYNERRSPMYYLIGHERIANAWILGVRRVNFDNYQGVASEELLPGPVAIAILEAFSKPLLVASPLDEQTALVRPFAWDYEQNSVWRELAQGIERALASLGIHNPPFRENDWMFRETTAFRDRWAAVEFAWRNVDLACQYCRRPGILYHGTLFQCPGCREAWYDSKLCQRQHWQESHRRECPGGEGLAQ